MVFGITLFNRDEKEEKKVSEGLNPHPSEGEREHTDLFCLILFIAFWVGMLVVGVVALTQGEPERYDPFLIPTLPSPPYQSGPYSPVAFKNSSDFFFPLFSSILRKSS
eukprot:TRINITY_DN1694_c0_g1_i1.p2 TRINITY_DN1694_c0_g1~~TRINITY_DN1694_c0_g1_i1.p2  ORF type:complete len:108 (-),score=6.64 TRINITY_DN1694_c0_g1_i1:639-962(-)